MMIRSLLFASVLALAGAIAHAQATLGGVSTIGRGTAVVVNPVTHRAYIADETRGGVAVLDGLNLVAVIPLPRTPTALAVNAPFNRIYAANTEDGVLSIIDGNTNSVRNLAIGARPPLVVNELRNRVYAAANGGMLSMDGEGNNPTPMAVGGGACDAALNAQTDQLYVANCTGRASVVDLLSGAVTSFSVPGIATAVAVIPLNNRAYVISREASPFITVIDGASRTARTLDPPGAGGGSLRGVKVVTSGNRVYITRGFQVLVLDAGSETLSLVTSTFEEIRDIAADPTLNKVFVIDGYRRMLVIDQANQLAVRDLIFDVRTMAIDASAHKLYVAGAGAELLDLMFTQPVLRNFQGMWWNPAESGWGVDIVQQGNTWFAAWFTYDEFGHPTWFVMPNGKGNVGDGTGFGGTLYRVTGSPYTGTFDPSRTDAKTTGFVTFSFTDADNGTMEAIVNNARITKPITRQVFGPVPRCAYSNVFSTIPNYTDLWWRSSESGWGLFLTHQGDNIFLVWFTYDTDGTPMWLVGSNIVKTGNLTYSGPLYRTTGPPFTASPWNASNVSVMPVGTATLQFPGGAGATVFTYSVGGVSGQKFIGRQEFSSPATVCG